MVTAREIERLLPAVVARDETARVRTDQETYIVISDLDSWTGGLTAPVRLVIRQVLFES